MAMTTLISNESPIESFLKNSRSSVFVMSGGRNKTTNHLAPFRSHSSVPRGGRGSGRTGGEGSFGIVRDTTM